MAESNVTDFKIILLSLKMIVSADDVVNNSLECSNWPIRIKYASEPE